MKFQIGKYYQHGTGRVICIIGECHTFFHGSCLLAEEDTGVLIPVGADKVSAQNWHQVSGWARSCYAGNNIPDPSVKVHDSVSGESDLGQWLGAETVAAIENQANVATLKRALTGLRLGSNLAFATETTDSQHQMASSICTKIEQIEEEVKAAISMSNVEPSRRAET